MLLATPPAPVIRVYPAKTVLNVGASQGLNLDVTALANRTNYTIVMDVRSPAINGYNKLMSLDDGSFSEGQGGPTRD